LRLLRVLSDGVGIRALGRNPGLSCGRVDVTLAPCRIESLLVRIAKPILLVTTPVGLAWGLYEAHQLAGGLVFLMAALIAVIAVAMISVVLTIRRERREEEQRQQGSSPPAIDASKIDPEDKRSERL
jgi:hypothetical protein